MPKVKKAKKVEEDTLTNATTPEADKNIVPEGTETVVPKEYLYPTIKEDWLNLYKLLQDMGIHSISQVEVKIVQFK